MGERVRFGSARPGVRRELVSVLRSVGTGGAAGRLCDICEHAADEIESLERKISRIGGVLVDVLEWADAQDPELRPDWVEKLTAAVEDEC